jgi:hypothetical protein
MSTVISTVHFKEMMQKNVEAVKCFFIQRKFFTNKGAQENFCTLISSGLAAL